MHENSPNLARLYLPLLISPHLDVRQQTCAIMLSNYGEHALTYLRRLFNDPDPQVQHQAHLASQSISEIAGISVEIRPPHTLHVECLGGLRVCAENRPLGPQDWMQIEGGHAGWHKVQGVFAYLVHCGRHGAYREALGPAVWGGPVSVISLSRTLTALRQVLVRASGAAFVERALSIGREHCTLMPEFYQTDVQLFEQTFDIAWRIENADGLEAAAPLYAQTMHLYTGSYMAGIPNSDNWSRERRDHLSSSFIIAAERLAEHSYKQQRYRHCMVICRQALSVDETAEDVNIWLLQASMRLGHRSEFRQTYRRYLRAVALDQQSVEGQQNPVVQAYRELRDGQMHKMSYASDS